MGFFDKALGMRARSTHQGCRRRRRVGRRLSAAADASAQATISRVQQSIAALEITPAVLGNPDLRHGRDAKADRDARREKKPG